VGVLPLGGGRCHGSPAWQRGGTQRVSGGALLRPEVGDGGGGSETRLGRVRAVWQNGKVGQGGGGEF
jgi:hypothetical protein